MDSRLRGNDDEGQAGMTSARTGSQKMGGGLVGKFCLTESRRMLSIMASGDFLLQGKEGTISGISVVAARIAEEVCYINSGGKMLNKFYVNNFKSLMKLSFEPGPVNLIIGLNNAGKTNLCLAMQFLSLSSYMTISDALLLSAKTLSFPNIYSDEPSIDFKCNCELIDKGEKYEFEYFLSIGSL